MEPVQADREKTIARQAIGRLRRMADQLEAGEVEIVGWDLSQLDEAEGVDIHQLIVKVFKVRD